MTPLSSDPAIMASQPALPVTALPVSISTNQMSAVPGILVNPPNISYVSAFPTDQPYQGTIGNMEFRQSSGMLYSSPHCVATGYSDKAQYAVSQPNPGYVAASQMNQ